MMSYLKHIFVWVFCFAFSFPCFSQSWQGLIGPLVHSTVRIDCQFTNGNSGTGTGFIYGFEHLGGRIPVIVTCRHVIAGALLGGFYMTIQETNAEANGTTRAIMFPGERAWIGHPDTNIDLAIMPIAGLLNNLTQSRIETKSRGFTTDLLATDQDYKDCSVFQEIKFIGYPIGIWDAKNNLPIARRGMIATDPSIDYEGKPVFLIDAAVFPGSSGSPVLIADEPGYQTRGNLSGIFGARVKLIGIITGGFEFTPERHIQVVPIPNSFSTNSNISVPVNLGVTIKANQLNGFYPALEKIIDEQEAARHKAQTNAPVVR